ncbi:MAG: DegV family protein [Ignavibacteriales bacterium]
MIKVITDSSCDLSAEALAEYNIEMIPLTVTFANGESFLDRVEISPQEFAGRLSTSPHLPRTSNPDVQTFFEVFEKDLFLRDGLLYISISSKLSTAHETAMIARKMLNTDKIKIIDSLTASSGVGMLAIRAAELVDQGQGLMEIVHEVAACRDRMETVLTVNTLDNLIKGHRLTKTEGFVDNLLDVRPILWGVEGEIDIVGRIRGRRRSLARMAYLLNQFCNGLHDRNLSISHLDCMEDVEYIKWYIEKHYGPQKQILVSEMGATVGTYIGRGGIIMSCY